MASKNRERRKLEQKARRAYGLIKLGGECVKCGSTELLEFDHIDKTSKELELSRSWCYSFEKFYKELNKCQLLCKTCHHWKSSLEQSGTPHKVISRLIKESNDVR